MHPQRRPPHVTTRRRLKDAEQLGADVKIQQTLIANETVVAFAAAKAAAAPVSKRPVVSKSVGRMTPAERAKERREQAAAGGGGGPSLKSLSARASPSPLRRGSSGSDRSRPGSAKKDRPASATRARGPDPLARMAERGKAKVANFREKELRALELAEAAAEEDAAKHTFAPKTNVITKRKIEEKRAKVAKKREGDKTKTLSHLTTGGWKGELPLPGSYEAAATVVGVFKITEEDSEGGAHGYLRLLPEGELGGPEGMVVRFSAWDQGEGGKTRAYGPGMDDDEVDPDDPDPDAGAAAPPAKSPRTASKQVKPLPTFDIDLHFPPSLAAAPVPCLMVFRDKAHVDIAIPIGDQDGGVGAKNPRSVWGNSSFGMARPLVVEYPYAILSLAMVDAEELEPRPKPPLRLGTSLKNVAMSILKEVKKLTVAVLRSPTGRRLAPGQPEAVVGVRLWNLRILAKVDVDPFWSVLKLRAGFARLVARYPPLAPGGELAQPTYLAQAMEDEKDGALRDRLEATLEEIRADLEERDIKYGDDGWSWPPNPSDDDEVEWFVGSAVGGVDPLGACILTEPSPAALRRLRTLSAAEKRPARACDVGGGNPLEAADFTDQTLVGEDLGHKAEKGKRGALIMAAERNKQALEAGSYGKGGAYETGKERLGTGSAAGRAGPGMTVNDMRVLKLEMNDGRSLVDEALGALEDDKHRATAEKRANRLAVDAAMLNKLRNARLRMKDKADAAFKKEQAAAAKALATGMPKESSDPAAAAAAAKALGVMMDLRFKRLELSKAMAIRASRKRTRPAEFAKEAEAEQAMLTGVKVVKDPAEIKRLRDKMLLSRQRKLMDFLPGKGTGAKTGGAPSPTKAAAGTRAAPKAKQEMSAEEKEMLAILKGISSSNSDKFSSGPDLGFSTGGLQVAGSLGGDKDRPKIKDARKLGEIAKARVDFIASGGNKNI